LKRRGTEVVWLKGIFLSYSTAERSNFEAEDGMTPEEKYYTKYPRNVPMR